MLPHMNNATGSHNPSSPIVGSSHQTHNQAAANAVAEHGANNFATIRTTSIVTKQQKEHMQVILVFCYYFVVQMMLKNLFR